MDDILATRDLYQAYLDTREAHKAAVQVRSEAWRAHASICETCRNTAKACNDAWKAYITSNQGPEQ